MLKSTILVFGSNSDMSTTVIKSLLDSSTNNIKIVNMTTSEEPNRVLSQYYLTYNQEFTTEDIVDTLKFYRPSTIINLDPHSNYINFYSDQIKEYIDTRKGKSKKEVVNIIDVTNSDMEHEFIKYTSINISDITFYGKFHNVSGTIPELVNELINGEEVFINDTNVRLCDLDNLCSIIYHIHFNKEFNRLKPIECNKVWLANFLAVNMDKYLEFKNKYHNKIYDSQRYKFSLDGFDKNLLAKVKEILHWYITMIQYEEEHNE